MATISSTLRLIDGYSTALQKSISGIDKLINSMDRMNNEAKSPALEQMFNDAKADIHTAGAALDEFHNKLSASESAATSATPKMASGFNAVSKAIIVVNQGVQLLQQGYYALSGVMDKADNRTGVDARLGLINDGLRTQAQLEAQVLQVANDTRSSYESTGALIASLGRQDYFKGANDAALAFAETINKGFVVSGASAAESQNAITQLTQAIASGVLRGDEFNSMMENAPILAESMATSLGITKGKLREMAEEGELTADVVVNSIMKQQDAISAQFNQMPVTFGQATTQMQNHVSELLNTLSQPEGVIDNIIGKVEELNAWLNTSDGQAFITGLVNGLTWVADTVMWLGGLFVEQYNWIVTNWSLLAPIIVPLGLAIMGVVAAMLIYKAVTFAVQAAQLAAGIATAVFTGTKLADASATAATTAAQWGLNASLLACPITWIILAIIALIAIIVALVIWIIDMWNTNVEFKAGVIGIWNGILNFFDQVPIFFMKVGYGIADAFSNAKILTMNILEGLVNGAIDIINKLIDMVNNIPGVSIDAIDKVSFGVQTEIEEKAAQAERAANVANAEAAAAAKAADRATQLAEDKVKWAAEAAAKKAEAQSEADKNTDKSSVASLDWDKVAPENSGKYAGAGGKSGKSKEVDLSSQTLQYLNDIAEMAALKQFDGLEAFAQVTVDETAAALSDYDKELLMDVAGKDTQIYYLNFQGGGVTTSVQQGEDWETIKQQIREESQQEIDIGFAEMEEYVLS